jgi:hypothetical protein
MWQTVIEDIDAISIGLQQRLPLPDVPLAADSSAHLAHVRM